ncbi:cellulose synthase subunit BcsC-related outer membrane protein [Curvibacter sp. RS43]|uniref:cellulose synthase subunit BcsC-related outer membrane protein n=1 Tax=Curvibacter microcysteis TaxID=3026419 RepID=UPI00235F7483|nr:cellulose synthase subunit BcsC-related outer membrane protein [Curvibacter sp. RS43]MDD0810851.1 cellulose synthase subunit BcsC-related outer membrane protein [Curvibacter sp. RS43]
MYHRHQTLAMSLLAALSVPAVYAQEPAQKALLEQGKYWQSRGNSERAAEAWQKLLKLDPNQPDALGGMAVAEADNKNFETAAKYLAQLKRNHPSHASVARIEQAINVQRNAPQLQTARDLAKAGKPAEAINTYQNALGNQPPRGPLALEYYQTLGGTAQGWDSARKGLEQLVQDQPDDARVALALAQHLTYRDATRREGIAQLSRLASHADVGSAAIESWRKALAWTGSRSADIPLYQQFLRAFPGDASVQSRLADIERQQKQSRGDGPGPGAVSDPLRKRTQEAFRALDDGDLEAAEAGFRSVLEARPTDGDALGGFGVLRLRQENFGQARDYLERASRQGQAGRWKSALDSATYWTLVAQSTTARENNNLDAARQYLQQAVRLDPRETTAENDLADVLVEMGQYDAAEATYRRVLARQSDNPDAVRGLVGVLAQNNKADEALRIVERMSPTQQEKVGALGRLRATQALGQAKAAAARGDDTGARVALENALLNDPANAWVRLDLARLYIKLGAKAEARGIMDGLLISNPNMPEALYAHALLSAETQDWAGAMATLDRVPEANRTRDIAALYKRVWVHVQADGASALAAQGRQSEALAKLAQTEQFTGQDPELLGAVALAYTDAGDSNRAMATIRQLLARSARPEPGLRLQYAAILLKTKQDVELAGILRQLQGMPMTLAQRQSFEDLRVGYVLRQADALREAGDLAGAYDTLAPVLADRPNDPLVMGSLARMYAANNDYAQAITLYNRLLEKDPNNLQLLLPAASLAISAREYPYAESAIQIALVRAPNNPEVLTAAARLYRAQGKTSKATEYFTAAVAAENQQRNAQLAASGALTQVRATNPFANRNNQPQRQPFAPLVPGAMPTAVPVGTSYGNSSMAPVAEPLRFAPVASLGGTPAAPALPQPLIPVPAGAARASAALTLPAYPPTGAGPVEPPVSSPTPSSYLTQTYQPAPINAVVPGSSQNASTRAVPTRSSVASSAPVAERAVAPVAERSSPASPRASTANSRSSAASATAATRNVEPVNVETLSPAQAASTAYARSQAVQPVASNAGYAAASIPAPAAVYGSSTPPAPSNNLAWAPVPLPAAAPPVQVAQANPLPGVTNSLSSNSNRPRTAADELNDIRQDRIPVVSLGMVARVRQGEAGMSQLTDVEAPLQLKFDAGDGKMSVNITPVSLNSGTPDLSYGTLSRFGGGPVTALALPDRSAGGQSASGVGFSVGYETDRLKMDVGTTPLGFNHSDVTGGVKYRIPLGDELSLTLDGSRRPVTDSLLSFAGTKDPRTGDTWGGVSSTGGRIDLNWETGDFGIYTYGSLYGLTGTNVASNSRVEGGGGIYWRLDRGPHSALTTGLNFTALSYDKNLRYFTAGHGGYFSPQRFLALNVPVEWAQRSNRFSYQLKGSMGVQSFREDAVAYFPNNSSRQAAAVLAANDAFAFGTAGATATGAVYPGQTKTGLGYNLGAAMEYQVHPQVFFGGQLALDNARDYRQFIGGIYLRYALQPYSGLQALPVNTVRSPYGNNN